MKRYFRFLIKHLKTTVACVLLLATLLSLFTACSGSKTDDITPQNQVVNSLGENNYLNMDGKFSDVKVTSSETAIEAINSIKSQMGISEAKDVFAPLNENALDDVNYFRVSQKYKDIPVFGRNVIVAADANGDTTGVYGNYIDLSGIEIVPSVSQEEAETKAKEYLAQEYGTVETGIYTTPQGLSIYSLGEQKPTLAWSFSVISYEDSFFSMDIFIDAITGELIAEYDNVYAVKAKGQNGAEYNLNISEESSAKYLEDTVRNIYVRSYDYNKLHRENYTGRRATIDEKQKSSIDAAGNIAAAYDYYSNILSRRQYDGKKSKLTVIVNAEDDIYGSQNAYYHRGESKISFTVTPGKHKTEFSAYLDIVAHEFTHGVTHTTCNLIGSPQSGAINEALSDIMGEMVEKNVTGKCDFKMNKLRDITKKKRVKDYKDSDGIHKNSMYISHAAYLMWDAKKVEKNTAKFSMLGNGKNNLSTEIFAKLWYGVQLRLTPDADFVACRTAAESSAKALLATGQISKEYVDRVSLAFAEVGIGSSVGDTGNNQNTPSVPATALNLPADKVITIGETDVIEPDVEPSNSSYTINWKSSNASIATVTPEGIIFGLSKGDTTLTATLKSGSQTITKTMGLKVASKARDTILVLDISGSMDGTPIDEMKKSAIKFCNDLLTDQYNNKVGLVCYDSNTTIYNLTNNLNDLTAKINALSAGTRTNMAGGLEAAQAMMETYGTNGSIKNIVIMADGLPNEGATSMSGIFAGQSSWWGYSYIYENAVIEKANEMMKVYNMYSLGFFHSLSGSEYDNGQMLMEKLTNKESGYHSVDKAENLQFAFGDIAETINLGSKVVINIACPVEVTVSYDGQYLSSKPESFNDNTNFGTLKLLGKNKDIKVLSLDSDKVYDIDMVGTDTGKMDYSVNYFDSSESLVDYRRFSSVPLTASTKMTSTTENTGTVDLNIDKDGDGITDTVLSAEKNSEGDVVNDEKPAKELPVWAIVLIISISVLILIICIIIVIVVHKKSKLKKENDFDIPLVEPTKQDQNEQEKIKFIKEEVVFSSSILILSGSMKGTEIPIKDGETLNLGKDSKISNIVLSSDYERVSRLHCTISFSQSSNKYYVVDCSYNGTYTGEKIRLVKGKRTPINRNSILILADDGCSILFK